MSPMYKSRGVKGGKGMGRVREGGGLGGVDGVKEERERKREKD